MKSNNTLLIVSGLFCLVLLLIGCNSESDIIIESQTPMFLVSTATQKPTVTPIPSKTPPPTFTPTPTKEPQSLGRIFPENFHGQTIWSDAGGNQSRNYQDQGWHCPPDGSTAYCKDHVIHFDVALPNGFTANDPVLSPVDGNIVQIYDSGEGMSIVIEPDSTFLGLEDLLNNTQRISDLGKGVFDFSYDINEIKKVALHLAHMIPSVKTGDKVRRGDVIGTVEFNVEFNPKKVAYVIYLYMKDQTYWQFGPCDVANDDEFCGICTPGSPYCPYKLVTSD